MTVIRKKIGIFLFLVKYLILEILIVINAINIIKHGNFLPLFIRTVTFIKSHIFLNHNLSTFNV